MAEPTPTNCQRCGKAVLAGTVEELWQMQLDPQEVPYEDAKLMHRYMITLVQVKLTTIGERTHVAYSRMFHPSSDPGAWITLLPHVCRVAAGGRIGERYEPVEEV